MKATSQRITKLLAFGQFAIAAFLLMAGGVIYRQNQALKQSAFNVHDDRLVVIENRRDVTNIEQETLHNELKRLPGVASATTMAFAPWQGHAGRLPPVSRGPDAIQPPQAVNAYNVSFDFFSTFDIPVLAGRTFSAARSEAARPKGEAGRETGGRNKEQARPIPSVVIDRRLSERLGFQSPSAAVGQLIYMQWSQYGAGRAGAPATPIKVLGVVQNRRLNIQTGLGPVSSIYMLSPRPLPFHIVRVSRESPAGAVHAIDTLWKSLAPSVPINRQFVSRYFEENYKKYSRIELTFSALAMSAFLISLSGLFGVSDFVVSCRIREMGVRKTLGARSSQLFRMLLHSFLWPIVIGGLVASPFAAVFRRSYLDAFDNPISPSPLLFLFSIAFLLLVAASAVTVRSWRAAHVSPSKVLRN